ncbi:MAG: polysaccharide deacetylase family protein [Infirmifilum sp.]
MKEIFKDFEIIILTRGWLELGVLFFVITGPSEYNGKKLLTSRPELVRANANMGHEIGSSTHTHHNLTKTGRSTIEDEFLWSIETLRSWGIDYELSIAYPYGSFNN